MFLWNLRIKVLEQEDVKVLRGIIVIIKRWMYTLYTIIKICSRRSALLLFLYSYPPKKNNTKNETKQPMRTLYSMFTETHTQKCVTVSSVKDSPRQGLNQTSHIMIVCLLEIIFRDMCM
jgi:hypothetical protein